MSLIWHELEHGAYAADLALWDELAAAAAGPILELGCGTGRVGLRLARRGHQVTGLDLDAALIARFNELGAALPAEGIVADARDFHLDRSFTLALAPMQLVQLLDGEAERSELLACVSAHLCPRGRFALAIAELLPLGPSAASAGGPPDVAEVDGWVYSSLPLETVSARGRVLIRSLRQAISPSGELSDQTHEVSLCPLDAATLEREATATGLRPLRRRAIAPTDVHTGPTVVVLEKEA